MITIEIELVDNIYLLIYIWYPWTQKVINIRQQSNQITQPNLVVFLCLVLFFSSFIVITYLVGAYKVIGLEASKKDEELLVKIGKSFKKF